jgi:hypothetical protein
MRSIREIIYVRLVIGCWYSCICAGDAWYFKFLNYDDNFIISSECYSPYDNINEVFYSTNKLKFKKVDGPFKMVDHSWVMREVVNGRKVIGG